MIFASDNWAGAAPQIAKALSDNATGMAPAYGTGEQDRKLQLRFNELFEREVVVYFVGTGTMANSLALASLSKPGGISLCHREAHIIEDECSAPEFFSSGGRLLPINGPDGKMDPAHLQRELDRVANASVHHGRPTAVSMTQATEAGTVYTLDEIEAIGAIAHKYDVPLHMDGARFANAMVALNTTPAEMTWKRGVDLLSFGATKNGCWCAEAVVFFDPEMASQMPFIHKRAGQLYSKARFITTQFHAYLDDGLWIELAKHANAMADNLRAGIDASNKIRQAWPTNANEVFVIISRTDAEKLKAAGAVFGDWHTPHDQSGLVGENQGLYRFVTSFATNQGDVDNLLEALDSLD